MMSMMMPQVNGSTNNNMTMFSSANITNNSNSNLNAPQVLPTTVAPVPPRSNPVTAPTPTQYNFTESWKTMWDDELPASCEEVQQGPMAAASNYNNLEITSTTASLPILDTGSNTTEYNDDAKNNRMVGVTPSSNAADSSSILPKDQWAPTPLSEIRAKQLRRMVPQHQSQSTATSSPSFNPNSTEDNASPSVAETNITTKSVGPLNVQPLLPPPPSSSVANNREHVRSQSFGNQPQQPGMKLPLAQELSSEQYQKQSLDSELVHKTPSSSVAPQHQQPVYPQMGLLPQPTMFMSQQQPNLQPASLSGTTQPQQQQPSLTVNMAQQLRHYHLQLQQLQQQQRQSQQRQKQQHQPVDVHLSTLPQQPTVSLWSSSQQQDRSTPSFQHQPFMAAKMQSNVQSCNDNASVKSSSSSGSSDGMKSKRPQKQKANLALPSTCLPPSVLTSILPASTPTVARNNKAQSNYKKRNASAGKSARVESPQDVLERITSLRGMVFSDNGNSLRIKSERACYDTSPSPLQLASFGTELVKAIHLSDVEKLGRLLATGLSPNPCNQFRDSIVDLVCKRGNSIVFKCLVEHRCDLRVCDGFGRTPLHHCCWASEFSSDIASSILETDLQQLFMEDKRGQTPLEYVRPEQANDWIEFLENNANKFFPSGSSLPPILSLKQTRENGSLPDPANALPIPLAKSISAGTLTPDALDEMDAPRRAGYT